MCLKVITSPAHKIFPVPGYGLDVEAGKVTEGTHKPPDYGTQGYGAVGVLTGMPHYWQPIGWLAL